MATAQQALEIAASQIGVTELPPNSNDTPYGKSFGLNGEPWCAIFVWWVETQAGVALPIKTAGVYALMAAFKAQGAFFSNPQPGDVVLYNFGAGHCGLVEQVSPTTITTIEGNTGIASNDNGGEVMRRVRPLNSSIFGYGRPNYSPGPVVPTPIQEDDDMDALTVRYANTGHVVAGTPDGALKSAGAPSYGSFYSLRPDERQVLANPLTGFYALTPVNPEDESQGVIGWVIGTDNQVHQFKFDQAFAASHS